MINTLSYLNHAQRPRGDEYGCHLEPCLPTTFILIPCVMCCRLSWGKICSVSVSVPVSGVGHGGGGSDRDRFGAVEQPEPRSRCIYTYICSQSSHFCVGLRRFTSHHILFLFLFFPSGGALYHNPFHASGHEVTRIWILDLPR